MLAAKAPSAMDLPKAGEALGEAQALAERARDRAKGPDGRMAGA